MKAVRDPGLPYALIVGQGRSGTNFLLQLLDLSPRTHCRNEPYANFRANEFARLPEASRWYVEDAGGFGPLWDDVVARASMSVGERDHPAQARKRHVGWRRLCQPAYRLWRRRHLRPRAGAPSSAAREEWPAPGWAFDRRRLAEALPVFKLNQAPGWASWALEHRAQARVVQIIRHPAGFLKSWRERWLRTRDEAETLDRNRRRLRAILEVAPGWSDAVGDVERLDVDASELWFWAYANEVIYRAAVAGDRGLVVSYDGLCQEPVATTRRVYDFAGLAWSPGVERGVERMAIGASEIAGSWRGTLGAGRWELVEGVLAAVSFGHLWSGAGGP